MQAPGTEKRLWMYETMVTIRQFEEKVYFLFLQGEMPSTLHLYIGQEAVATGVCAHLRTTDYITSTHRPHGHAIAKGVPVENMMAELFGRIDGCCRGKSGSMHVGDMTKGAIPAIAIVGGGIPIATGVGLSAKMRKTDQVAVCFFGDGATSEGDFHEALNMAAIWDLPVIYVCENNLYGASTPVSQITKCKDLVERVAGYCMAAEMVEGNDVLAVYAAAGRAIERARRGGGPTFLECKTYRTCGHSRGDPQNYRSKEEVAQWQARDPILLLRQRLLSEGVVSETQLQAVEEAVTQRIEKAVEFARKSPFPALSELTEHVYYEER